MISPGKMPHTDVMSAEFSSKANEPEITSKKMKKKRSPIIRDPVALYSKCFKHNTQKLKSDEQMRAFAISKYNAMNGNP